MSPSRRVSIEAFEKFLEAKKLPAADSLTRSAESGLPLDPSTVKVVEAIPIPARNHEADTAPFPEN